MDLFADLITNCEEYDTRIAAIPYNNKLLKIESDCHWSYTDKTVELIKLHKRFDDSIELLDYFNDHTMQCEFCNARKGDFVAHDRSGGYKCFWHICNGCVAYMKSIKQRVIGNHIFEVAPSKYIIYRDRIFRYSLLEPDIYPRIVAAHNTTGCCEFCSTYWRARNEDPTPHIEPIRQAYIRWTGQRVYCAWLSDFECNLIADVRYYIMIIYARLISAPCDAAESDEPIILPQRRHRRRDDNDTDDIDMEEYMMEHRPRIFNLIA